MSLDNLSGSTASLDYPEIRPTLDLNFARTKTLDPRVTFSRSSGGTYVGADGLIKIAGVNQPRFDHNPVTGESLGLLVEEARTNYFFAFASPSYNTSSSAVYSTYSDSRFGATQNAHSWTWPSAANAIELGWFNPGSVSTTGNGVQYTISYWAKANQAYTMNGGINDERRQGINFAASLTTSWQYFSFSTPAGIADDGTGTVYLRLLRDAVNHAIPAGLRIDFAAVNLERGGFPTSYIPTSGSTVTRSADVASMTGTNYASFINYNEGTWVSSVPKVNGTGGRIFDSRASNRIDAILFVGANTNGYSYASGGAIQINASYPVKGAVVYNSTDVHATANGTINTGNTGARTSSHTYIDIGSANTAASGVGFLNGPLARLTYYPVRLPDAQLQALTK
jgi:hypothetical protein